jgi:hypothetical protein
MKIKYYVHGNSETDEILEELEEKLEGTPDNIKEKIALEIYNYLYEVGLDFEFDTNSGELISVKLKD